MNSDNKRYIIDINCSIFDALEVIDKNPKKCLIVLERNRVAGTLTDGDIRRTLIKGSKIEDNLKIAMNINYIYLLDDEDGLSKKKKIEQIFGKSHDNILPVIKKDKTFIDLIFDFEENSFSSEFQSLIVAGGEGKRLNPLTLETPKPLISIGGEPILFRIINQIVNSGIKDINISVHYQYEKIMEMVGDGSKFSANINYIIEDKPLGTLGSASKLENKEKPVLLINSDILTNMSFNLFIDEYMNSDVDMLMGIKEYVLDIPYGVVELKNENVNKFTEKPKFPYFISAGINILSPLILKNLPEDKADLPDVLNFVQEDFKIKSYLISEYWTDIGNVQDLNDATLLFEN